MKQRSNRTQTSLPVFLVGGSNQGLAGGNAVGTIELPAKASITDGDTLTLDDGVNGPVVFEFDVAGDGVTSGNVAIDISGDTTAVEVATTSLTVITGSVLTFTGTRAVAVLTLTNTSGGNGTNVTTWASDNATIQATIVQPTGGGGNYSGSGTAFNIADRQLAVVASGSEGYLADGDFITTGDTVADVPAVSVLQGTPNSQNLQNVNPFGYGHKSAVKSAGLSKSNLLSVATYKYDLGRYSLDYLTGVGTPVVGQKYALTVTVDGPRLDITHGENREVLQVSVEIPTGSNTATYLLEQLAIKFNDQYSKFGNGTGDAPVVALGIGAGGTVIGGLTSSDTVTYQNTGTAQSLAMDRIMINSLNTAIGNVAGLSTATIVPVTGSATLTGLLIVVMHEDQLAVVDTLPGLAMNVETTLGNTSFAGTALAVTNTKVSSGSSGVNSGRQVALEFDRRARQLAFSLENYVNHNEYPLRAPTYVDENAEGYNVTVLQAKNVDDTPLSNINHQFQDVFIVLPSAVSNPNADADTGYTIATTQTATVTALNNDFTPWLASTDADFLGDATSSAVFG